MAARTETGASPWAPSRARCRCGHLPTHHMVVVPTGTTANYLLEATGPCVLCGEAACRKFTPGGA
ncbi:MAG: hypothetical protein WBF81_05515 [Thermoplasmata archaeon]